MYDSLDIAILHRAGSFNKQERHSVDFIVNGISLFAATKAQGLDMCGRFSSDLNASLNNEFQQVFNLLAQPDTPSNRVMLFVCSECGDIGCGAITIKITKESETYIWSEFAYENDYDDGMTDFSSYTSIGPFRFESQHYHSILSRAAQA